MRRMTGSEAVAVNAVTTGAPIARASAPSPRYEGRKLSPHSAMQ